MQKMNKLNIKQTIIINGLAKKSKKILKFYELNINSKNHYCSQM
jgi:hypothetical protein